jgi:putative transposase
MRRRYDFLVTAYVVMPEHVHLLVSEPRRALLSRAIQSLKLSVAVQSVERPFWQPRYYDFNVYSERKCLEKRRYIHRNPVTRGLVKRLIDWPWSSFRHWWTGEQGKVEIESRWTAMRREKALNPVSQQQGHGAPISCKDHEMWATQPEQLCTTLNSEVPLKELP